jgi:hypothetical protein
MMHEGLLLLLLALPAAGADASDDPMLRWDCDRAGQRLVLEMVRPPLPKVSEREVLILSGTDDFEQCRLGAATWTLLVDIVEYETGRCAQFPDTIVSLMRDDKVVLQRVLVSPNCHRRPVLSAARVLEPGRGRAPRVALCAAQNYGGESRCATLGAQAPVDNDGIARRANGNR